MTEFGQSEISVLFDVLEQGLTARATTVQRLSELTLRTPDEILQDLEALERLGFLEVRGRTIHYRSPEAAIGDWAEALLGRTSALIDRHVSETQEILTATPRLIASWSDGVARARSGNTEVFHGEFAPTDLWLHIAAGRNLRSTDGILPDATRIFGADQRRQRSWFEAIAREELHVRTILSSRDVSIPGAQQVIDEDMAVGAEFRMLPEPPSWLWIADDDTVGLPYRWGDSWPTSVFATTDPAVVSLIRWLYERLWAQATPVTADSKSWDPLLALMSQGATLESAAHALGISARTGRRRIAAALEHFGVDGLFALGAAWQRVRA